MFGWETNFAATLFCVVAVILSFAFGLLSAHPMPTGNRRFFVAREGLEGG